MVLIMSMSTQANLLSNGDFNLPASGAAPTGWTTWAWGGGWSNHENLPAVTYNGTYYQVAGAPGNGGGGVYQLVPVTAGASYTLTVDSGADAWWLPTGTMAMVWLRSDLLDPLDPNNIVSQDIRNTVDPAVYGQNYDIPHPWANYSLAATAPAGAFFVKVELAANNATGSVWFENASLTLTNNPYPPYNPDPTNGETGVIVNSTLSWHISDPNGVADPHLVSHKLYMSDGISEPNLAYVDTITGWDGGTLRASYTPVSNLITDGRYFWRVDMVKDDTTEVTGPTWVFYTQPAVPDITAQPTPYTLVDAGDPVTLSVTVNSFSPESYQWYKDGAILTGKTNATLSITSAQIANEGSYYCEIRNDATLPAGTEPAVVSDTAVVGIKRQIAHWSFEAGSMNSSIGGAATVTTVVGDPAIAAGISGDGMAFDADTGAEDMLYTDPNETYFDICNYNMTVGCWIKSTSTVNWAPLVARNGEEDGWQLRQGAAGDEGDDRPVFSTRGLAAVSGGNDGTPALKTAFDGNWHYVVATYDGAKRTLYVDGLVQMVWWVDIDGPHSSEGDDATGTITPSASGVSIAGRYGQDPAGPDTQFSAGIYDEVEIWNYARSAEQIAQTYATLSGQAVCPAPQDYDLNGDCKVNLDDFALLASVWLADTSVQP